MKPVYISFVFTLLLSVFTVANACKGCVNLDEYNFDKIVPKFEVVLVKFDVAYPYGDKHQAFSDIASELVNNNNIITGQVGVKDYGEKENQEFAKKYGINSKDDLPAIRLFVRDEDEPFAYDKNMPWTNEDIKKFIRDHTSIYLGLPGCLEAFDKLAIKFTTSSDKKAILKQTEEEVEKLTNDREKAIANTYVKFMKKVVEISPSFVKQEQNRLDKILKEGKLNEKKKEELSHRANILKSFAPQPIKTEL